jgi:hypothetical protein
MGNGPAKWVNKCSSFTGSLIIPNSVDSIGSYAFFQCSGLSGDLTIGNSVSSLGGYVFFGCSGFNGKLTIGTSIKSINYSDYSDCVNFTSITIPASVTSIGDLSFSGMNKINKINIYIAKPLKITLYVFSNVNKGTCTLNVPIGSKSDYRAALQWKDFINIVEMPTAIPLVIKTSVTISPNPINDYFEINGVAEMTTVSIQDLNGRIVFSKVINSDEKVCMNHFDKGIYIVKLTNSKGELVQKVIKR